MFFFFFFLPTNVKAISPQSCHRRLFCLNRTIFVSRPFAIHELPRSGWYTCSLRGLQKMHWLTECGLTRLSPLIVAAGDRMLVYLIKRVKESRSWPAYICFVPLLHKIDYPRLRISLTFSSQNNEVSHLLTSSHLFVHVGRAQCRLFLHVGPLSS